MLATRFEGFLTKYQSDDPLIAFLHDDLLKLVKFIMELPFKLESIECLHSLIDFNNFDLMDKADHGTRSNMEVGFASRVTGS